MTGGLQRRVAADGVTPLMNVTPLVDVVLVLLIIFMVVAPQLAQDTEVTLPGIFNADPDAQSGEPFKVTSQRGGQYHFQGQLYDLEGIIATLQAEHAADPLRRLVLSADAQLRYADISEFQRRLEEVGFPGMAYMVNERHRAEDPTFGTTDTAAPDAPAGVGDPLAAGDAAPPVAPIPLTTESPDAGLSAPAPISADGAQPWQ